MNFLIKPEQHRAASRYYYLLGRSIRRIAVLHDDLQITKQFCARASPMNVRFIPMRTVPVRCREKGKKGKEKKREGQGGGSRRRESYICVSLAAQRAFAFLIGIGKGKGKRENKISVYSRRASSPAKCSAVSFSFRWNIHFSRQINPREQCTFADGIADAKVAICLGEFSQSPRRPPIKRSGKRLFLFSSFFSSPSFLSFPGHDGLAPFLARDLDIKS